MAVAPGDTFGRDALMGAGLAFRGEPLEVSPTPWLPTNLQAALLHRHVPALVRAAHLATRRFVEEPVFRRQFGYGALQEACILKDPGYEPDIPLGRFDCFLKDEGVRFLEFNTDGTAGWHYASALNTLARERLGLAPERLPLPHRLLTALVKVYGMWSGGKTPRPSMAIVDWEDVGTRREQEALAASFGRAGCPCTLADPRALRLESGRLVGPAGPIDLVYRRVVSEELFARADEVRPFLDAYMASAACFAGSFRSDPAWSKTLFAVFTDPEFRAGLAPADRTSIEETIPFTAPLAEGTLVFRGIAFESRRLLLEERPHFVAKPSRGYGGRGVHAGAMMPPRAWEKFIDGAIAEGGWVVQEFVDPPFHPMPFGSGFGYLHAGAFVLLGQVAGLMARVSERPLLTPEAREVWLPTELSEPNG